MLCAPLCAIICKQAYRAGPLTPRAAQAAFVHPGYGGSGCQRCNKGFLVTANSKFRCQPCPQGVRLVSFGAECIARVLPNSALNTVWASAAQRFSFVNKQLRHAHVGQHHMPWLPSYIGIVVGSILLANRCFECCPLLVQNGCPLPASGRCAEGTWHCSKRVVRHLGWLLGPNIMLMVMIRIHQLIHDLCVCQCHPTP